MLRPVLNRVWASASPTTRRDPGEAKYLLGWISEIPTYQVLNYLQYKQDTTMLALAERGVFEWGADIVYKRGALAWDENDSRIYIAKIANPGVTRPGVNPNWEPSSAQISRVLFDQTKSNIDNHIAATNNPHGLLPGTIGAYTKTEVDALVATYRAQVLAHASNTNNPHQTTAADVNAVPVTGGTYTGDVIFSSGKVFLNTTKDKFVGYTDAGVWLKNGQAGIGILDTGVPVARDSAGTSSEIITEKSFATYKAQVEPSYTSPMPQFFMPLSSDINIYYGDGTVDYNQTPTFIAGMIDLTNNSQRNIITASNAMVGADSATLAIDFMVGASVGTNVTTFTASLGDRTTGVELVLISDNSNSGWIEVWLNNTMLVRTAKLPLTPNARNRLVVVLSTTAVTVYGNGTLRGTTPVAPFGLVTSGKLLLSAVGITNYSQYVSNLRVWRGALDANRVSAL